MYGVRPLGSLLGTSDVLKEFNGGGTFAAHEFVSIDGSGEIVITTAGTRILGVANEAGTSSTDDIQVNITPFLMVLMDNDNDTTTFSSAHIGEYAAIIGSTGATLVDSSTHHVTTVNQLYCLEYNPQGYGYDSDTSIGKYLVVEAYWGSPYTE